MTWGPTWSNTLPLRIVYITTPGGKARLLPHPQPGNIGKATHAPANAILAVDSAFHHQIPRLYPFRAGIRDALQANPGLRTRPAPAAHGCRPPTSSSPSARPARPPGPWDGSTPQASMPSSSDPGTGGHSSSSTSATPARAPGTDAGPGSIMPKPSVMRAGHPIFTSTGEDAASLPFVNTDASAQATVDAPGRYGRPQRGRAMPCCRRCCQSWCAQLRAGQGACGSRCGRGGYGDS
jgi:hypothetical protein